MTAGRPTWQKSPRLNRRAFLAAAMAATLVGCKSDGGAGKTTVTLAAAASLRRVTPLLIAAFTKLHPKVAVRAAYGASGDLRKRVQDGAPIDAVLLANAKPVDDLVASGHVVKSSRRVVAGNGLVLIAKEPSKLKFTTLEQLPADEKLAIGDPGSVPAGEYAKQALQRLGSWDKLGHRMVLGGDVAAVLAYARRGEVAAAVVYSTEVRGIDDVVVLDVAKGDWAPRPEVVVGLVKDAPQQEQGRSFLAFVASEQGRAILVAEGFVSAE